MEREKTGGIGITGIGQLHVPTKDQARAVAFYSDVLGLPLRLEVPGWPSSRSAA